MQRSVTSFIPGEKNDRHRLHRTRKYGQPHGRQSGQVWPCRAGLRPRPGKPGAGERAERRHRHGRLGQRGRQRGGGDHHAAGGPARAFRLYGDRPLGTKRRADDRLLDHRCRDGSAAHARTAENGLLSIDAPVSGGTSSAAGTRPSWRAAAPTLLPAQNAGRWRAHRPLRQASAGQAARSATT